MEFSANFLLYLNTLNSNADSDGSYYDPINSDDDYEYEGKEKNAEEKEEDYEKEDDLCFNIRNKFESKILALQGKILEYEGMKDEATDKFIKAAIKDVKSVPWVGLKN